MTADDAPNTRQRLTALQTSVVVRHQQVASETRTLLEELIGLIRGLDPIRRPALWPAQLIQFIAQRQQWICPACGLEIPSLNERAHHVDHVIPWSSGGGNEPANLQVLHRECNLKKGAQCDPDELIRYLHGRLLNLSR